MNYVRHSLLVACLLVIPASSLFAQVLPRPDKPKPDSTAVIVPEDSAVVEQDTTQAQEHAVQDSVHPIPQLAPFYRGPANGFSSGIWVWDREALMNEAAVTLGELLRRIPGINVTRIGLYLQPELAASMGGTANRLEVWLDGYVLDPLLESSVDLTTIELAQIDNVRIERRPGMIRVHLESMQPRDNRAYSHIEAGVSLPTANLFRGLFLAPKLIVGPLGLAIDRLDTDGLGGREEADQFAGWGKLSFIRNGSGLQVEFRRSHTVRGEEVPWPEERDRSDVIVRARARIREGLVAELFGGQTTMKIDTARVPADSIPILDEKNMQLGGRVSFTSPLFWARGSFRTRDAETLPSTQLDAAVGVQYKNIASATAEVAQANWRDAGSAAEFTVRAEAGPFRGVRVFGETTSSDRGVPYWLAEDSTNTTIITNYTGMRVGATADWRGIGVGAALLKVKSDSASSYGLPFDRVSRLYFGADATGWELSGRVPLLLFKGLYGTGMITDWRSGNISLYMPTRSYRAGVEVHTRPLKSGNLEILARVETVYRGAMVVPSPGASPDGEDGEDGEGGGFDEEGLITMPNVQTFDAYLQIRIIDLRAYIRFEDLSGQRVQDFPERTLNGPRQIYGVKWQFFN